MDWRLSFMLGLLGLTIIWAVVEVIFINREANRRKNSWEDVRKKILEIPRVGSIPTSNYTEVIEVNLPIKFYWTEDGFDGVSFDYPDRELFEWEQEMLDKCMRAVEIEI